MSTVYVIDTNSWCVFGNYYPEVFASFWDELGDLAAAGRLVSCREVANELDYQNVAPHIDQWVGGHRELFGDPSEEEMRRAAQILAVPHFQQLIGEKQRLKGWPVADPWVVARGAALPGCVVTEEKLKPNAAKIPNVCEHFGVRYTNAQGFLAEVGWRF
jgi:hypothetical protein